MELIIAVTGASGIIYAKSLLDALKQHEINTHLIISEAAEKVAKHELEDIKQLEKLATNVYPPDNLEAPIASGSYQVDAMIIIPASMKTIGALASGYTHNLITRAADVQLKERRKLIVVPRETPLHTIHLENLNKLSQVGAVILPAMPGFYHNPETIEDLVNLITGKILDQLGIPNQVYNRWKQS